MGKMSVITDGIIQQLVKIGRLCVVESGKVYDVTDFAERHPGGPEKIAANVGRDVTEILQAPKSHRHSPAAYSMLKQYCIGEYAVNSKSDGKCTNGSISSNGTGHLNNNKGGCYFEDEMVDWSKPLMWQVAGLKDQYFDWVHRPVDRQIRLFKSDLVEYFSKCSWYIVPLVWVPVAAIFLWMAYDQLSENPVTCSLPFSNTVVEVTSSHLPLLVLAGATCWTLAEYIIHRWLFHLKPPANIPLLIQFHFLMHGQHHKTPMDKRRLVFPPIPASGLALTIYLVYTSFFSVPVALALMAGTTLGYLVYDLTHYYLHHGTPRSQYFQELKRYHVMHHYVDQQNGFGISSKLWDYPFGTLIKDKAD